MDKDDLTALLVDAPAEEVDQIHRLLHEWSVGPDSSFPVQLSLLTRAQWRIAANLPRLMNDSRKLIELHLAEYRRQSQAMADDFAGTVDGQKKELKKNRRNSHSGNPAGYGTNPGAACRRGGSRKAGEGIDGKCGV
jgi:hypothetical protein